MSESRYGKTNIYSPWKDQHHLHLQRNEQYQLLIEFQLRRQKQKNIILEQRLRNKQLFISQMKQFQAELTIAYQKCQQELRKYQKDLQFTRNVEIKQYVEQIAQLKHQIIRYQDNQQLKNKNKSLFNSSLPKTLRNYKNHNKQSHQNSPNILHSYSKNQLISNQVHDNSKILNFATHFLAMAELYYQSNESKLTKRLKVAWKWIKQVVKQWQLLKVQLSQYKKLVVQLKKLIKVEEDIQFDEIIEALKTQLNLQK